MFCWGQFLIILCLLFLLLTHIKTDGVILNVTASQLLPRSHVNFNLKVVLICEMIDRHLRKEKKKLLPSEKRAIIIYCQV